MSSKSQRQHQRLGLGRDPEQVTLSSLLTKLTQETKRFGEEYTEVSYETRKRVTQNLQQLRQAIAAIEDTYRFPYLSPIQLLTLDQARSDALLEAQAFHLEYDQLELCRRLYRQRDLYQRLVECLEAGKQAYRAIRNG